MRATATFILLLASCSTPGILGGDDAGDDAGDDGGDDHDGGADVPDGGTDVPDGAPPPDATAPDANPEPQVLQVCASGGAPYTTIGSAIAAARAGDTVEVCAGTYGELVVVDKPLTVRGLGGAATTVIDGGGAGTVMSVVEVPGSGVVVEGFTITGGAATNGAGIRCVSSELVLRDSVLLGNIAANGSGGLHATGCALDVTTTRFENNQGGPIGGGGMLVDSSGSVHGCELVGNQAVNGAGLAIVEGSVAIDGNIFRNNNAGLRGGGLYHNSDGLIAGNSFIANQAGWTGGGFHVVAHAPLIRNNIVRGNSSLNDGGGIYLHQSTAILRSNTVQDNVAGDDGGGIRVFESPCTLEANLIENNQTDDGGGGVRISHVPCTVIDNIVRGNYAGGTGGGMDLDNDASTVRGGEITGNRAGGSGGGIFTWLAPWTGTTIEDVLIANNRAWRGAGIFIDDNFKPVTLRRLRIVDNDAGLGGGIMVRATNLVVLDTLIAGNEANLGGGIYHAVASPWWDPCTDESPCPPAEPTVLVDFVVFHENEADDGASVWSNQARLTVRNSIVTDSLGPAVTVAETPPVPPETMGTFHPPTWRYNNTFPATFVGMGDPTGSNGNLAVDPLFVDAVNRDFHLAPGSACVDAGDPQMEDADGTRADMGLAGGAP